MAADLFVDVDVLAELAAVDGRITRRTLAGCEIVRRFGDSVCCIEVTQVTIAGVGMAAWNRQSAVVAEALRGRRVIGHRSRDLAMPGVPDGAAWVSDWVIGGPPAGLPAGIKRLDVTP